MAILSANAKLAGSIRTAVAVNDTVREKVEELMPGCGSELRDAYDKIVIVSKQIDTEVAEFVHNPLQCYMAAEAAVSTDKQFVTIARPASGKTTSFLLLANYLLEVDEDKTIKVIIFVEAGILHDQCSEKIAMFPN